MRARTRKVRTRTSPGPGPRVVVSVDQDKGETARYEVAATLKALILDETTPAAAKVNAARTLAEIDGLIGRHQTPPERGTPALASLSRDDLVAELERLRTAIGLGIVG